MLPKISPSHSFGDQDMLILPLRDPSWLPQLTMSGHGFLRASSFGLCSCGPLAPPVAFGGGKDGRWLVDSVVVICWSPRLVCSKGASPISPDSHVTKQAKAFNEITQSPTRRFMSPFTKMAWSRICQNSAFQSIWLPSRELTYPLQYQGNFEDDFPFPQVGYVNFQEGILI